MQASVYNIEGTKTGEISLNPGIFEVKIREGLIHEYLRLQQANLRRPIAYTKRRDEVRGGGRKPWKQKGTGRARQGSIRSPQWRGGGVVFGPRNERNFELKMPKKERRLALFSLLSSKAQKEQVMILEDYAENEIKTKFFAAMLKKLPIPRKVLIVMGTKHEGIEKSSRNIPHAKSILVNYLNPKDLLTYDSLLFLKESLPELEKTFLGKSKKAAEPLKEKKTRLKKSASKSSAPKS